MTALRTRFKRQTTAFTGIEANRLVSTRTLVSLAFLLVSASMLFPLFIVIVSSFKTVNNFNADQLGLPRPWTFGNFTTVWNEFDLGRYILNSCIVVGYSLLILLCVVVPAGYAFAHLKFRGSRFLLLAILSLVIISPVFQIIPIFQIANQLGFINSQLGLAIILVSMSVPFGVYLMANYFEGVPRSIFDAASIDGAGPFGCFIRLALPLARPGVLMLLTFSFLQYWNDYIFSYIIILDPSRRTLQVALNQLHDVPYQSATALAAGLVIAMIPCILVFLILQRNLNEGLTAGALKE